MSKNISIKKLLEGVEVEWKSLGEVGELVRGSGMQKKDFVETGFPAIHYGQIYTRYGLFANKTFSYVSNELVKKLKIANKNDLLIATTSENDEDVLKPLAWLGKQVAISGDMMLLRHNQNVKYLAYCFLTDSFQKQKTKYITGVKVRRISKDNIAKLQIPIPPLKIQNEIVRILDTFTELTTELTARKKQYQFYRDKLLTFEEGEVEWKRLGEVVKIKNGKDWKKLGQGNIPVYGSGGIMGFVDTPSYSKVSVLIPRKGTITNIFYVDKPFWNVDTIFFTKINEDIIIPKYFYYFMSNYNLSSLSTDSTRPSLTQTILNKILIPIPPLKEQQRIVSILDKFDTLTNSISEGLPKEIELRQKQYEYYRDLLLSFPKEEN